MESGPGGRAGCPSLHEEHAARVPRPTHRPSGAGGDLQAEPGAGQAPWRLHGQEDGPDLRQGVEKDRLLSVHDPEMRHGRKSKRRRFDGHKAQVAVDTDSQIITAVEVLPGNAPDRELALELVDATERATGCAVEETIADSAYGDGATRQRFHDAGRVLVAKVPALANQGYFLKTQFRITLEAGTGT